MSGRRALVTGASAGLGQHLALGLAAKGWLVTGIGRRPMDPGIKNFDYLQADLSRFDAVESLAATIGETPDLIVHSAATYPDPATTATASPSELESIFRVNALAPYLLTRRLLADKPDDKFCCTVMVNSEAMFAADQHSGLYAASKAALRVLATGLADACRASNASVATLLLGPLAGADKLASARAVAEQRGVSEEEIIRIFLARSNPNLVIDKFIDYDACLRSVEYIADLGPTANGMVCRLDGGSAGSLI
ncbi:MAG TPA: SDR family oxidoreductase [Actinomycetales bacterium]|nr:SDR family oxidoreductase [Actinomycetales bacterium]